MGRRLRAVTVALLLCAGALAIALASAPRLHDQLHRTDSAAHQCAATLLTSGGWEHSAVPQVMSKPAAVAATPLLFASPILIFARAGLSILEHAPPACA